jgi:exodeoxyribonuclease VII large subunit
MVQSAQGLITERKHSLQRLIGRLEALSPLAVLERGYSLTCAGDGRLLKSADGLKPGEEITTRLSRERIYSKVLKIEKVGEATVSPEGGVCRT